MVSDRATEIMQRLDAAATELRSCGSDDFKRKFELGTEIDECRLLLRSEVGAEADAAGKAWADEAAKSTTPTGVNVELMMMRLSPGEGGGGGI